MRTFLCLILLALASVTSVRAASITFIWDRQQDPSVVNYNLYVGPATQTYTNIIKVGNVNTYTFTNADNGVSYFFNLTANTSTGMESPFTVELSANVPALPSITSNPNPQVVPNNSRVTFTVVATGPNLAYQWRKDGVAIEGATLNSYVIQSAVWQFNGIYSCVVTNVAGSATSENAQLLVIPGPTSNFKIESAAP